MNCFHHATATATASCDDCACGLCPDCARPVRGVTYCDGCLDDRWAAPPPSAAGDGAPTASGVRLKSPRIGAILSAVLPGLGQAYNGLVARGVAEFATAFFFLWLLSLDLEGLEPIAAVCFAGIYAFAIFDAYSSAKEINRAGRLPSAEEARTVGQFPLVPNIAEDRRALGIALVAVGGLVILAQAGLAQWIGRLIVPLGLIGVGLWLLRRTKEERAGQGGPPPVA